jgi:hypothetical protein
VKSPTWFAQKRVVIESLVVGRNGLQLEKKLADFFFDFAALELDLVVAVLRALLQQFHQGHIQVASPIDIQLHGRVMHLEVEVQ